MRETGTERKRNRVKGGYRVRHTNTHSEREREEGKRDREEERHII